VVKNGGKYECTPDDDGRHGDTFDSGKLAHFALQPRGITTAPISFSRGGGRMADKRVREVLV